MVSPYLACIGQPVPDQIPLIAAPILRIASLTVAAGQPRFIRI
jgi:hypothetical protein